MGYSTEKDRLWTFVGVQIVTLIVCPARDSGIIIVYYKMLLGYTARRPQI